jgi:hypothetical protein
VDACDGSCEESGSTSKEEEEGGAADDRPGMDLEGPESGACDGSGGDCIVAVDEAAESVEALFSSSGSVLISGGGVVWPFMLDMTAVLVMAGAGRV